ncbi:MAG TPA: glutamate synthase central domain-containing protein, partial [Campylobacterales bacterium]|nr:glutamate synthase central domain-containing protein [Campylobacterales bacterium]
EYLKNSKPYAKWLNRHMLHMQEFLDSSAERSAYECDKLAQKQLYFGYNYELIDMVVRPMMEEGKENTGSMGDDTPLAAFSKEFRPFGDYFKQKFAQVTNPPIDPIRERVVMSLNTGFGEIHNILSETEENAKRIKTFSPLLSHDKLSVLLSFGDESNPRYETCYKNQTFYSIYENDLEAELDALAYEAAKAIKEGGVRVIVLDDRAVCEDKKFIPMAMVVGRLNSVFLEAGVRHLASIVCISAEAFDSHTSAVLVAYGASAIYPYLFYATVYDICKSKELSAYQTKKSLKNAHHAIDLGFQKILSKMGIATIASYRNSGLFDCLGLSKNVVQKCFAVSYTPIGGLDFADIAAKIGTKNASIFKKNTAAKIFPLEIGGFYKFSLGSEYHDYSPSVVYAMQKMVETGAKEDFLHYKALINGRGQKMIRDFLTLSSDKA